MNTAKRAIWPALRSHDQDVFWYRREWAHFERMLDRYPVAPDARADPRSATATSCSTTRTGRTTSSYSKEHPGAGRDRLGERRRNFRNLPRLNSLLRLMLLDLRGQADESQWARILRENHLAHHGQPPPRRRIDGQINRWQPCGLGTCAVDEPPRHRRGRRV